MAHAEIPRQTPIGKNLRLPHNGNGVIVVRESTIGNNVVIRPQVIIGRTIKDGINAPKIGNNVDIGVGVKILGDVTIGDNVKIGANAVVVKDIPANCTAIGIPATVIKK
ncbi:serine O-acetyltransferase [Metabacillus litoralis]|uniref:serine O-acetyltransferase n=1 Tax=Metabacillus litoralis TaxID=152268 RepID=UPI0020415394|nr:hypothetical protein [Metabacillus litoralis]MCM3652929.1 hypothetical protein [Metabacillus litoralis]